MDKHIYDLALELRKKMEEDPDICLLNEYEAAMTKDETIKNLAEQYASVQTNLNDLLKTLDVEHPEVKKMRGELSLIKYQLDRHPVVITYQNQYKIVAKIYHKINQSLFQDFLNIKECKCL